MDLDGSYKFVDRKVIIRLRDRVCESPDELFASALFREVIRPPDRQPETQGVAVAGRVRQARRRD